MDNNNTFDNDEFMFLGSKFDVITLSDIEKIPINTKHLVYYFGEKINFALPQNLHTLSLSGSYEHSLDFIIDTQINTLCISHNTYNNLINNIPYNIHTLMIGQLRLPLLNIPPTIKKIQIYGSFDKELLFKSKIPFGCEVFYGCNFGKKY